MRLCRAWRPQAGVGRCKPRRVRPQRQRCGSGPTLWPMWPSTQRPEPPFPRRHPPLCAPPPRAAPGAARRGASPLTQTPSCKCARTRAMCFPSAPSAFSAARARPRRRSCRRRPSRRASGAERRCRRGCRRRWVAPGVGGWRLTACMRTNSCWPHVRAHACGRLGSNPPDLRCCDRLLATARVDRAAAGCTAAFCAAPAQPLQSRPIRVSEPSAPGCASCGVLARDLAEHGRDRQRGACG